MSNVDDIINIQLVRKAIKEEFSIIQDKYHDIYEMQRRIYELLEQFYRNFDLCTDHIGNQLNKELKDIREWRQLSISDHDYVDKKIDDEFNCIREMISDMNKEIVKLKAVIDNQPVVFT
jgi:hypothetical protein